MKISKFQMILPALFAVGLIFMLNSCAKEDLTISQNEEFTSVPTDETNSDEITTRGSESSANGQGGISLEDGTNRHFSFHANTKKNGDVKGNGVLNYTAGGVKIEFDIDCLQIDGNTGVMSGTITHHSLIPDWEGANCWFQVTDNGEGSNEDPDQITLLLFGFSVTDCSTMYEMGIYDVENGNIQVKP